MGYPLEAKTKDVWVFIETKEGKARNVGIELLNPGRRLADGQGGGLTAVVVGSGVDAAVKDAVAYGADKVYVMDAPIYERYTTEAYTAAMTQLIEKDCPTTVLIGATPLGRDLGPRLAARLHTGLTADCTALDLDDKGNVAWTRPAFGGNLMATIICSNNRPQIGTCRPGVFKKIEPDTGRSAEIIKDDYAFPEADIVVKLLEVIAQEGEKVDLEGADIIVSGGRGVGGPEGFAPVRALAEALGGVTGSSRAAVDAGWIPYAHQVGQTGKTVAPKLYVACGISGAIQHLAGMSGSDNIVCVNKDADAPIFSVADFGVVGDLFAVLPVLTELINKSKG